MSRTVAQRVSAFLPFFGLVVAAAVVPLTSSASAADAQEAFPLDQCPQVQVADVVDEHPINGPFEPQPRADGEALPVIFIHGLDSSSAHLDLDGDGTLDESGTFSDPMDLQVVNGVGSTTPTAHWSLIGAIQEIPGAAVYTFDYGEASTEWVTHPSIGPALADAIECLTTLYGNKAVIVGHSMGGLATRYALAQTDENGAPIAERVAHVVTFGTPNEGSPLANGFGPLVDATNAAAPALLAMTTDCAINPYLPCFIDTAVWTAVPGLGVGSPELEQLPSWPSDVPVTALYGSTYLYGLSLFGDEFSGPDAGDLIVPTDSAIAGSTDSKGAQCDLTLIAIASTGNAMHLAVTPGAPVEGPYTVFDNRRLPCLHTNLMRTVNITVEAIGVVADAVDAMERISGPPGLRADDPIFAYDANGQPIVFPVGQLYESHASANGRVVVVYMGANLYAPGSPQGLYISTLDSRSTRWLGNVDTRVTMDYAGETIAVGEMVPNSGRVRVYNLATGDDTLLEAPGGDNIIYGYPIMSPNGRFLVIDGDCGGELCVFLYDRTVGSWRTIRRPMHKYITFPLTVTDEGRIVYVYDGRLEVYSPIVDSWSSVTREPIVAPNYYGISRNATAEVERANHPDTGQPALRTRRFDKSDSGLSLVPGSERYISSPTPFEPKLLFPSVSSDGRRVLSGTPGDFVYGVATERADGWVSRLSPPGAGDELNFRIVGTFGDLDGILYMDRDGYARVGHPWG